MISENTDRNGDDALRSMIAESYEEREHAVEMIKKCIQAFRDRPNMKHKERWGLVQTIHLFWRHLPCPYTTDVDLDISNALEANEMNAMEDDEYVRRDPDEIRAEIKARAEREEAEEHAEILKELGTTDEELERLSKGLEWGFYPYELVQASSPEDWEALHNLRRSELFARREGVIYNDDHPDDRASNHFPLVLKFQDQRIGTARLDLFDNGGAAIRLVAIAKEEQRKGHGRVMEELFEELARSKGVSKLFVNAHPTAVGYYERLGFVHEEWKEPSGVRSGLAQDCVLMTKQI